MADELYDHDTASIRSYAGLTRLRRLALFGCAVGIEVPGPGWNCLRRLEQLELADGTVQVDDERHVVPGKPIDGCLKSTRAPTI